MSKNTCERCERQYLRAANRSHSNIKTLRRQKVNLQKGVYEGRKAVLCTKCIKTLSKEAGK